jgi:choline dehydrogenase-like flavoprotein
MQAAAPNIPNDRTVDLKKVYDAIVVGSGAAGGMAAYVLASAGMKTLLLEAGRRIDTTEELKSTEWPYEHPRRGEMPPDHHALTLNEYTIRKPPYAEGLKANHAHSYVQGWGGSDYSKNIVVDEKDHPYTGTNYAWVRARCLGGKTNIWGRLALRLSENFRPALPLQIRRQRKEDVRGHGRRRAGDDGGRRIRRGQPAPQPPHRRLVDPRIGRGQDGN